MKLGKLHMGTIVLVLSAATALTMPAQACGWGSGCGSRTTEGVFREYGPKVPDGVRRGATSIRRGTDRVIEELRFLAPKPGIGRKGLRTPSIPGMLLKPRCAGEDC